MFMSMLSHLLRYVGLAHRPVSEPDLERWCKYWAVVGAFVAFEYVAGWILDWVPFYWEARTVFLLFLSLPQTQGSTWVFTTYFQPFLEKNQADIDANIAAVQSNTLAFLQSRLQVFWQTFWDLATKANGQARVPGAPGATTPGAAPAGAGAAPNPGQYIEVAKSLWTSYGSSLIGAAQQAVKPASNAHASAAGARPGPSPYDVGSSSSVQTHQNSFSSEMVNNFNPASSASSTPPPFPQPQVPTA
ncbi:TB2/DP1, HVA22 family-domain-containing protein [Epithele typhae]|uniref:TB2/DP1, HVA22 family-domain-containing protein n=1 Tax=Epithele typhae TaxID=378194 RepID=UPI0020072F6C|nr:TB2/DP1, HVA22 family-domain-containing protein [Epithele typhae]KAH9944210.1 TB2/DP1, HVA22 family-domain-containing protein [Epithele typhae]